MALATALGCGCGGSAVIPHNPAVGLDLVRRSGAGPSVAVLPRPSGELVRVALWLDAGSRDAQPAQVATVAAWLAAEEAGANVRAHVEPEGSELALWCPRAGLERCLQALRRGLALRAPSNARVDAARARLIATRRRAQAADSARGADQLALQALYGEAAAGLAPLGDARGDSAVTPAKVRAFLADHFGPSRALLVAIGEIEEPAVLRQVAQAFAGAPSARGARAATRPGPGSGGVLAGVDAEAAVAIALAGPNLDAVQRAAAALRARLAREQAAEPGGAGYALRLRGHALVLLRVPGANPERAAQLVAHELEQLRSEGLPEAPAEPMPDGPQALARRLGSRWAAHGAKADSAGLSVGLGVQLAGGRADRLAQGDPDAETRERAQETLGAAWQQGRALGAPETETSQRGGTLSAVLENGARVELRAQPGERMAVALRFGLGAGADPPALHGRAALLASTAATACAGLSREQLDGALRELGAELEPLVSAEGWGLVLSAPAARWQAALALATDCALSPALERKNLSAGRLRLMARLGAIGGPGELRAEVAALVAPAAPGQLAAWGHPAHQASVSLADVRELWRASRSGAGLVVGVAGPLPSDDALRWIARRLAPLPAQVAAAKPTDPARARAAERPHDGRAELAQPTLGLALWQADLQRAGPEGAQAFAALVRAAVGRIPGVSAAWHEGGAWQGNAWAAVAFSAPPERLPLVADALRTLGRALPEARLARAADAAVAVAREQAAERAASAAASAALLATSISTSAAPDAAAARELAKRLAAAEPRFVPLR